MMGVRGAIHKHSITKINTLEILKDHTTLILKNIHQVRDDPKLLDDCGKVPKLNKLVGGSIPGYEIVSLFDGKLARWSNASCVHKNKKQ